MDLSRGRRVAARRATAFVALIGVLPVVLGGAEASAGTVPVAMSVDSDNGTGRVVTPGRSCDDGGAGAYWHYEYGDELPSSPVSARPTDVQVHLDLHSDEQRFPNVSGDPYPNGTNPTAFLQGNESHASMLTERGSVKLRLASGSCDSPTLAFDGSNASGSGTWAVDPNAVTGAYEGVTGNGTFTIVNAEVNPGADNDLRINFNGSLTVPNPSFKVEVVRTYWSGLGTDYLSRRVTVVYRITNTGPGDSYGARITGITDLTTGVTPMIGTPIEIGDLRAGETYDIQFRHQMSLLSGPCKLIILGCVFQTRFNVSFPDAFDQPHAFTGTVTSKAPDLPPPLSS